MQTIHNSHEKELTSQELFPSPCVSSSPTTPYYMGLWRKTKQKKTLKVCQHSIYNSITSLQTSCSASLTLHANSIKRRRGIKVCGWKWCEGHSVYPNNTWKNHDQKWLRNAGGRVICVGSKHCTGKHEPAVFTQCFCKNKKKYCILYSWPLLLHYI